MALHVALIEPHDPDHVASIGALCAETGTPLHLIGPLEFSLDGPALQRASDLDWDEVDTWEHPDWFAFRDAIRRTRCLYFSSRGERELSEVPFRENSVLVFGSDEGGLPARILEKHPRYCFRIPDRAGALGLGGAVDRALTAGREALASGGGRPTARRARRSA